MTNAAEPMVLAEMDPKEIIALRVAKEVRPGMLVNLGIGLPSLVANHLPADADVYFQAENGVIGLGSRSPEGMEDANLTDAGGDHSKAYHRRRSARDGPWSLECRATVVKPRHQCWAQGIEG